MSKNIVHINYSDKRGGAAIAAFRHNEALNQAGYNSKMLAINKTTDSDLVFKPIGNKKSVKFKSLLYPRLSAFKKKEHSPFATFSLPVAGFPLYKHPVIQDSDIIVIHWIGEGMLTVDGVEDILKLGKPVIWFLHDMWPLTGGCHYSFDCEKYESHCHTCPLLNNGEGSEKYKDISYRLYEQKLKKWSGYSNLRIFAPSVWLAKCASRCKIFNDNKIFVLRNVINTDLYRPIDKHFAREVLNLPQDKKLLLFGADSLNSPYKGWQYLRDAINNLNNSHIECVLFGNSDSSITEIDSSVTIHHMGRLTDDFSLILLYNACDLFVTPSIADNFPNVILEGMACGLPCVGFNNGGVSEMIQDNQTGIIAHEQTAKSISDAIQTALTKSQELNFGVQARGWVIENASYYSIIKNIESLTPINEQA